jgi:hypothetical protein
MNTALDVISMTSQITGDARRQMLPSLVVFHPHSGRQIAATRQIMKAQVCALTNCSLIASYEKELNRNLALYYEK